MAISQPPMMAAAPPQTDRHLHYLVYGQRLCSNMPLPELPRARFDVRDMGFRASVSSSGGSLLPDGAVLRSRHETNLGCELLVYDAPGAHVLRWQGQCDFLISRDGVLIEWRAAPGVVPEWVNSTLYGVVMSYVLHIRGVGNLHASAVALPSGVIGFLADPGGGKSTLAASFAARGYPLVTDDLFALQRSGEGYAALPGFPYVSLSPASAGAVVPGTHASAAPMGGEQGVFVDDPAEGGIERNDNKSRVPVVVTGGAFSAEPQPLRALYLLRRSRDIERIVATRPPAGEAARRLLEHTTCLPFLPPDAVGRQFAFVADLAGRVPVWELRYPSGFQYIDPVVERVLECSR